MTSITRTERGFEVTYRDLAGGSEGTVRARAVCNCAGPWADAVLRLVCTRGPEQAAVREAEADVARSEAALDRAKAESAYAENNLHRVEPLLVKQYVTVDQVDQARTTERATAQSVQEAASQLALNRAHLNTMLAALAVGIAQFTGTAPAPGTRVWDPVHGHFHDQNGQEIP